MPKKDKKEKKSKIAKKGTRAKEEAEQPEELFEIRVGHQDPRLDIKCTRIKLAFGGDILVNNGTLVLAFGHRYGLVGRNGTGKSTLLKAIASRQVEIPKSVEMLYVDQEVPGDDRTALEVVLAADHERSQLLAEEERLMNIEELTQDDADRLEQLYERLEEISADTAEARAASILNGLQFDQEMQNRKTKLFSGGWRMRLSLAQALLQTPSLLLLDEPTNHLDLHASIWLEDYLARYKKTLLVVSHNKEFLNAVCTDIIHIENQKLNDYTGNFSTFVKVRDENRKKQNKDHDKQEKEINRMKDIIQKTRGNASTAGIASSRKKALEKMEIVEAVQEDKGIIFQFPNPEDEIAHPVLNFIDCDFGYDKDHILYEDLNFGVDLESRVALVGPNGAGKTTLLNLFSGDLQPLSGTVERNKFLRLAKYSQHGVDELNMDCSAVQYMHDQFPYKQKEGGKPIDEMIRAHLGKYGLSGDLTLRPVKTLSGGQRARLLFAWISWKEPHILLLDEPTNHLDMDSIDALIEALNAYKGGVIIVSHDSYLISQVCDRVWLCGRDKTCEEYDGDFEDYKKALIKQMNDDRPLELQFQHVKL